MKLSKLNAFIQNAKNLKILYVEDHADVRLRIGHFLKKYFNEVTMVTHPEIALKMFNSGYYDLILTDAELPDMDTIYMCRRIKQISPKKPIVILSLKKDYDALVKLINIGISGFIELPSTEKNIALILSRVVKDIQDELEKKHTTSGEVKSIEEKEHPNEKEKVELFEENSATIDSKLSVQDVELLRMTHAHNNVITAKEFVDELDDDTLEDFDELGHIQKELDNAIKGFDNQQNVEKLNDIAKLFGEIASVLNFMLEFSDFSNAIRSFATFLDGLKDEEIEKTSHIIKSLIPAIFDDLKSWREHIFELQDAKDIHYLDSSLFSSIIQLQLSVTNELKGVADEDDSGDLELF